MRPLRFFFSALAGLWLLFLPVFLQAHTSHKPPIDELGPSVPERAPGSVLPLRPPADGPLWTRLHILDAVRRRVDFEGSLEVNYPAERGREVRLRSLALIQEGRVLFDRPLDVVLVGDGGWYAALHADLEKLPPEISSIYTNRRDYPLAYHETLTREETRRLRDGLQRRIADAQEDGELLAHPPVRLIRFDLPVNRLVGPEEFRPGAEIPLSLRLTFDRGEGTEEIRIDHTIRVEEAMPPGPPEGAPRAGIPPSERQGTWHVGDLHVHDCKDETSIIGERGCPTCYAETLNWGDDNSLGALKNQFIAKGADWFTITSHSYCVESPAEYAGVRADANTLSGPAFLVIPDTELQSEERGPQQGSDEGDLVCWNGVNHMGAHWIQSWKAGGSDGLLQFCSDPITDFLTNVESIRAEGGFGIINHPTESSWGWNSYELTHGFNHPQGFRGVEIWNGPSRVGQGSGVGWWVRNLLDGRPLYAFSGSDTHDDVFDFGWNHTYVTGAFTSENLRDALMRGRNYISSFQALVIRLHDLASDVWVDMGDGRPIGPSDGIELGIYYDFGTRTGTIEVYKGVVGDAAETLFREEGGLTGNGWLYVPDPAPASSGFAYYRAYSSVTSGGTFTAYTNPVYVRVVP